MSLVFLLVQIRETPCLISPVSVVMSRVGPRNRLSLITLPEPAIIASAKSKIFKNLIWNDPESSSNTDRTKDIGSLSLSLTHSSLCPEEFCSAFACKLVC